jgi:hypothetical protein
MSFLFKVHAHSVKKFSTPHGHNVKKFSGYPAMPLTISSAVPEGSGITRASLIQRTEALERVG